MAIEADDRPSDSPYIARVWRGYASGVERMTSIAVSTWEIVFWEHRGRIHVAVRGPETAASTAEVPDDSHSFGISFSHGTSMPHLPARRLVDTHVESPHVTERTFTLRGDEWELPSFENAEVFVARLARDGVLVRDPLVGDVVAGEPPRLGARSLQRRVAASTGLTQSAIRQIDRARHAAILLGEGVSPLDVVQRLGYYDQPHLSRSLTRFIGRTAKQLRRQDPAEPLSLLYKT
ncbi:helix-turn-helix domain-containing protein [Phytoactinopolyspora halotolerans]|uniref:AraC family transcriptional regulator n=1 Tax=Phytoactinopolyspora halotolerans TaxID=1981512 RepID=A0A6L9SE68_9ACTN|nr:helix-turn-helix domain-containing protein [Phytoactinopolyspora halotolerans]NEE02802.1 AraC family transcriptional regulator [Phytoactinopolyspora halotolerans]